MKTTPLAQFTRAGGIRCERRLATQAQPLASAIKGISPETVQELKDALNLRRTQPLSSYVKLRRPKECIVSEPRQAVARRDFCFRTAPVEV